MRIVTLAILILGSGSSFGEAKENVFVTLYQERVRLAKAEVRSQEAETQFQAARFERARYLLGQKAMAREEYERIEADYKKSLAHEDVFKARVNGEEAMLEVVKHLVQNGQPVPICRP